LRIYNPVLAPRNLLCPNPCGLLLPLSISGNPGEGKGKAPKNRRLTRP
jgi:hypothetical protein